MKYMYFLVFIFHISYVQAEILNENYFSTKIYDVLSSNESVLGCGNANYLEVYSSFDIAILLSISNAISSNNVILETNWENFRPPALTSVNFNETQFKLLPNDIKRLLFLCLTWNESERLKLFVIPDSALENVSQRLHKERPWKNLEDKIAKKADGLSNATLKEFIYIVLRANVFESVRGDILNNKSLWFISWNWLTTNKG